MMIVIVFLMLLSFNRILSFQLPPSSLTPSSLTPSSLTSSLLTSSSYGNSIVLKAKEKSTSNAPISPSPSSSSLIFQDKSLLVTLLLMSLISAPLGTMLDNQHGLFHVLEYDQEHGYPMNLIIDNNIIIKSGQKYHHHYHHHYHHRHHHRHHDQYHIALWVPVLFSVAGVLMSSIAIIGDKIFDSNDDTKSPSYPKVTIYS